MMASLMSEISACTLFGDDCQARCLRYGDCPWLARESRKDATRSIGRIRDAACVGVAARVLTARHCDWRQSIISR
jgi:hypothetical protein